MKSSYTFVVAGTLTLAALSAHAGLLGGSGSAGGMLSGDMFERGALSGGGTVGAEGRWSGRIERPAVDRAPLQRAVGSARAGANDAGSAARSQVDAAHAGATVAASAARSQAGATQAGATQVGSSGRSQATAARSGLAVGSQGGAAQGSMGAAAGASARDSRSLNAGGAASADVKARR